MRGTISKCIEELVSNDEVVIPNVLPSENYIKRLKKQIWNTLNSKEKTRRMKIVSAKKFLKSIGV